MKYFLPKKIFFQLYSSVMMIMVIMMLLVAFLFHASQEKSILEIMRTQAYTVAKSIELANADAMVNDDKSFLVEHNLNVLQHSPSLLFVLISNNDGEAILIQRNDWKLIQNLPPNIKSLEKDDGEYQGTHQNPFDATKTEIYYYVYPLNFNGILWGWIHIGFSLENLNHAYKALTSQILFVSLCVFIMISIIIFIVTKYIVDPITVLSIATKKMAHGNLDIVLDNKRHNEIGELNENFNAMAVGLKKIQNELKNSNLELEKKVQLRTKELEDINKNLDERVHSEILKQREQEQILIQQSRFAAMGEMIGNIAHQWRQPLNALSLLLQNVVNAYDTGRLDEKLIQRVNEKGMFLINTMSTTIDDFRNFFKPNKEKELIDISEQINKALVMIQASLHVNAIDVIINVEPKLKFFGFANEFTQVLLNILNNAKDALIEHKTSERTIRIESFHDREKAYITISDNAIGIKDTIINRIFDPYFTTKEEGKGTGIGLYMSKVIIENNMGGKLTVHNAALGAVFTISLPLNHTMEDNHEL